MCGRRSERWIMFYRVVMIVKGFAWVANRVINDSKESTTFQAIRMSFHVYKLPIFYVNRHPLWNVVKLINDIILVVIHFCHVRLLLNKLQFFDIIKLDRYSLGFHFNFTPTESCENLQKTPGMWMKLWRELKNIKILFQRHKNCSIFVFNYAMWCYAN